jgi:Protein-disulfide isomerase
MTAFTPTRRALVAGAGALALALALLPSLGTAQDDVPLPERGYALGDITLGDADAPVEIIEYSSLTCPHCANFHTRTLPEIKARYIDTGQAKLILREVYFDQLGLWGSMLARCGGEGPFQGYIETLFENQMDWARADDPVAELRRIGRLGGLSEERIRQCLTDEDFMRAMVERFQETAEADGVRSTPTFFINGDMHTGDRSVEDFAALIEEHL